MLRKNLRAPHIFPIVARARHPNAEQRLGRRRVAQNAVWLQEQVLARANEGCRTALVSCAQGGGARVHAVASTTMADRHDEEDQEEEEKVPARRQAFSIVFNVPLLACGPFRLRGAWSETNARRAGCA